jgi:hypothetical protein
MSGIATNKSGLVTINAFSDSPTLLDQNESEQKIYKENTKGRLLVGYSMVEKDDEIFIKGVLNDEIIKIRGIDDEGFVLS